MPSINTVSRKLTTPRKSVVPGGAALIAVVSVLSTGALASTRHKPASEFATFSILKQHPTSGKARAHSTSAAGAAGSAMLASQSPLARWASTDANTNMGLTPDTTVTLVAAVDGAQVYSYVTLDGSLCMQGVNPAGDPDAGGGNCAHQRPADLDGNSYAISANSAFPHNVAVELVPNGVGSVTFTDPMTGFSEQTPVTDNVAVDVSSDPIVGSFADQSGQSFTGVVAKPMDTGPFAYSK